MNITFFIGSTTGGGAERVVCELASYLYEHGHDINILTVTKTETSYIINRGVKTFCLDTKRTIKNKQIRVVIKLIKLGKFIACNKTDVYVVFLPDTIRSLFIFKKLIKTPIIVSERNNPSSYSMKIQKTMLNCFARAEGCVFQTKVALNYYQSRVKICNYDIIPNAVNIDNVYNKCNEMKRNVIVSAGRFNAQKNFQLLIRAFAKISVDYPHYKLIIYGDGEMKNKYVNLAKRLSILDKVILPGFVDDLSYRLSSAKMFVLSSDYEGIPNALIEAMSIGLPCISTNCDGGGAASLISDNINGLLVPKGDVESMYMAMKKILDDNNFAEKLGENALRIRDTLSKDKVYGQWEKYITSFQ